MKTNPIHGLYAITDEQLLPDDRIMQNVVEEILAGGASVLQYRDKSADQDKRLRQALLLKKLCNKYHVPLIINDDIELTLACKADGIHLGQQDEGLTDARTRLGEQRIIGISCNADPELARAAERDGANYVAFGRMFPSLTKPEATPCDPSVITEATDKLSIPIVAIGGITLDNAPRIIAAGAHQIAVIHSLISARDIRQRAQEFCRLFT